IQAVVADVELAALEPADAALLEVGIVHRVPRLEPGQELLGLLCPETRWIVDGAAVHGLILRIIQPSFAGKLVRNGIHLLGHGYTSSWSTITLLSLAV